MSAPEQRPPLAERVLHLLQAHLDGAELEVRSVPEDETFITVPAAALPQLVALLLEREGLYHLSTLTGLDNGESIELLYHFWQGCGITLRVVLPYDAPHAPSLTPQIHGASFYEREVMEMLGVVFEGHPHPQRLFLPDDWQGGWPLRRKQ